MPAIKVRARTNAPNFVAPSSMVDPRCKAPVLCPMLSFRRLGAIKGGREASIMVVVL